MNAKIQKIVAEAKQLAPVEDGVDAFVKTLTELLVADIKYELPHPLEVEPWMDGQYEKGVNTTIKITNQVLNQYLDKA